MNKLYKKILYILLLPALISCDGYLNVDPDNRQTIKTLEDVGELLVTAYPESGYSFLEWKTDNVGAVASNIQMDFLNENYRWEPVVSSEAQDTPTALWASYYAGIAACNQALVSLETVENTNDELKQALMGEALVARAYNHFILANVFCQHYDAATASSQLGIPYMTKPEEELLVSYSRGTLEETYQQIQQDLEKGLPLISNKFYIGSGKYHFTKEAALGFASRFYLFKGEYQKCIDVSNSLLGAGVVSTKYIRNMGTIVASGVYEQIASSYSNIELASNLLMVDKISFYAAGGYGATYGYRANSTVITSIFSNSIQAATDYRSAVATLSSGAIIFPKNNPRQSTVSGSRFYYFSMVELRAEEVIFNRMESYVRLGRIPEALADYNVFAPLRYKQGGQLTLDKIKTFYEPYGAKTNEDAMLRFLLDERRKEFVDEGIRWWDIKRFRLGMTHIDNSGNIFALGYDDLKKAEQIPAIAIVNGIEANPR